jgi:hypothetical protein
MVNGHFVIVILLFHCLCGMHDTIEFFGMIVTISNFFEHLQDAIEDVWYKRWEHLKIALWANNGPIIEMSSRYWN